MDINDLRSVITVLAFVTFIGIVAWAWSSRQKAVFDEAARLPLEDDEPPTTGQHAGR
ncbi:MAG: cbb3-type cytochrome c oxidase subunit 3 [Rhodocyclaceae bacterium]|nr:cbb3-type cytochrome c oxidase subunit 3 [Rhodocyclaceae bacterium]